MKLTFYLKILYAISFIIGSVLALVAFHYLNTADNQVMRILFIFGLLSACAAAILFFLVDKVAVLLQAILRVFITFLEHLIK